MDFPTRYIKKELEKMGFGLVHLSEAGSTIWGYANEFSDRDLRFAYKRTTKEYVRVTAIPKAELKISFKDESGKEVNAVGYDIFHVVSQLARRTQGTVEWILSCPLGVKSRTLMEYARNTFNQKGAGFHYLARCKVSQGDKVSLKEYLANAHRLGMARYVAEKNTPEPTSLEHLIDLGLCPDPEFTKVCLSRRVWGVGGMDKVEVGSGFSKEVQLEIANQLRKLPSTHPTMDADDVFRGILGA